MKRFIETYKDENFDVIVIGGGITGASVAYEAASRGLKVALFEKKDFSWATSAATSKMIHGGLRYLANGEIGLVRESLRERRVMENIAPNFVYPMPVMITHCKRPLNNSKWIVKIGMTLYDLLSYDKNFTWDRSKRLPMHRTISRKKVQVLEPSVRREGLTGASMYYDCKSICPERLTLAFIKSAVAYGASVSNYCAVEGFLSGKGKNIIGIRVRDLLNDKKYSIRGGVTINCAGPWADFVMGMADSKSNVTSLQRSEGIHIITTKKLISGKYTVGAMTPSGRHFFLTPWRGHTLIGTTDKPYTGDPDKYHVTRGRIMELISDVNSAFGDGSLGFSDVKHTYGGLRPLVEDQTEETYSSSRKYEIYDNKKDGIDGLVTVEGGKYTTSRNLAEHCVKLVERKLGRNRSTSFTKKRYLSGCSIEDIETFLEEVLRDNSDFSVPTLDYLARNYGTEYREVLKVAREDTALSQSVNADGEILAQAVYAIRNEMARTLSDIVMRRTGMGTLGHPGDDVLLKLALIAMRELNWDRKHMEKEISIVSEMLTLPRD
ncbi:MAG: glycerol-3-phosphate dehydrogenase [Spirochaetae bacterium HGW-Spirochaetae-1]|jgi:glycerol-3-phosphate dehydrogenase|nr:MAG: glycerol-3-phosphate dehydrogenase [Spirochaetae bacterium HGW-Spirochaetae-1]